MRVALSCSCMFVNNVGPAPVCAVRGSRRRQHAVVSRPLLARYACFSQIAMYDSVPAVEKVKDKALLKETEGTKESKIKLYCHRCCSKGHVMAGCVVPLFCQICEVNDHVAVKCPHKKNPRPVAHMVGYARDELGFFHIPHGPVKTPITNSSSDKCPPITLTKG